MHDYFGIILNYTSPGEVKITMYQCIHELLQKVPERYSTPGGSATPAPSHLYEIRDHKYEGVSLLTKRERDEYHSLTAQLLYLSKCGRLDLQTSIAFHCTRVREPAGDDDKKLARTVRYLSKTKSFPLILAIDKDGIIEWWIDAVFAVHHDMKGRTGMCMSLGKGTTYASSIGQKINTTGSIHAEVVGASDAMPKILWVRCFMEAQGYVIEDVYAYQDNESAILLEENGYKSVGKASRYIKIKHFFITDQIKGKELRVLPLPY